MIHLTAPLLLPASTPREVQDADPAALQKVADVILAWDGNSPGDVSNATRQANPGQDAIVSMRGPTKALADGKMPGEVSIGRPNITANQKTAQRALGDLEGTWMGIGITQFNTERMRFTRKGNAYTGVLVTWKGQAPWSYRAGQVILRVTRVSPHIYQGKGLRPGENSKLIWDKVTLGIDGNLLYIGDDISEEEPGSGITLAQRK